MQSNSMDMLCNALLFNLNTFVVPVVHDDGLQRLEKYGIPIVIFVMSQMWEKKPSSSALGSR
jgi:hypothetical protein